MKTFAKTKEILGRLQEARSRTLELVADLDDQQMMGPRLRIVNPLRWEIGHVGYFQEFWCVRHFRDRRAIMKEADALYDSARIAHDSRWDLPLPSISETKLYMQQVLDLVVESNSSSTEKRIGGYGQDYFLELALFHEQMHAEAITYTRQTLGYPAPTFGVMAQSKSPGNTRDRARVEGDALIPGGQFLIGSCGDSDFAFDNEQPAYKAAVKPFSISKSAVTEGEFAAFVDDNGYHRPELWNRLGWTWKMNEGADKPLYWHREPGRPWVRRHFDEFVSLHDRRAMIHVNWYEADAYCRWAGRRLPTEEEWEMAASCEPSSDGAEIRDRRRIYPWGDEPPTSDRANLDWRGMGCVDVDELPLGDSAFGCRQLIGNCWEWTSTTFYGYPGFNAGPYKEYSEPWFGDHNVLRGGCWATRSSMIRNSYRNFYTPDRRDVWAGFRTCAL
jgi:iron(II)-dependent oxidoreductase